MLRYPCVTVTSVVSGTHLYGVRSLDVKQSVQLMRQCEIRGTDILQTPPLHVLLKMLGGFAPLPLF
jgi:hypothetical protein